MQAYIAMPWSSAEKVDGCKQLDRAFVGLPKHVLYLSLKKTKEHAVQTAVEGNRMKLQVATEHTVWYCLELNVSVHDAFEMVQHGWLVRDLSRGGWRFYGKLEFACLQHTWYEATFPPLAVEAWAEKTLTCFPPRSVQFAASARKPERGGSQANTSSMPSTAAGAGTGLITSRMPQSSYQTNFLMGR